MSVCGQALFSVEDIRRIEHEASRRGGFPSLLLMERAAAAAWRYLRERWPSARRITVVCGIGNNAGDGYELARLAQDDGREVRVIQIGQPSMQGDASLTRARLDAAGIPVATGLSGLDPSDVIVDALFGIGLNRPVAGPALNAIEAMNAASAPCLSLDIPSGLDATTGNVLGLAVKAQATVCFIALKPGLVTGAAREHTGTLRVASLGVGDVTSTAAPFARLTAWRDWAALRRPRPRYAHKGDSGHVLLVGGAPGMAGAVRLAAEAALRTGAGLVSVAAAPEVVQTDRNRPFTKMPSGWPAPVPVAR
jgi:NAD(P)H-hydrate epimerase